MSWKRFVSYRAQQVHEEARRQRRREWYRTLSDEQADQYGKELDRSAARLAQGGFYFIRGISLAGLCACIALLTGQPASPYLIVISMGIIGVSLGYAAVQAIQSTVEDRSWRRRYGKPAI